jgi:hypothetical protein
VILHRCFAWDRSARSRRPGSALWFARAYQGDGRHDNPDEYGCLYLTEVEVSAVVEQLAPFRSQRLIPELLVRRGLPLALAAIEVPDDAALVDLDDPPTLTRHDLRPSLVATRRREVTQPRALALCRAEPAAAGLRWWSTYEALWANVTVFDRAAALLRAREVRRLELIDPAVVEAADLLGLASA